MSGPLGFLQEQHEIPESIHIVLYLKFLEIYQCQRARVPALEINVFHNPWAHTGKHSLLKFKICFNQTDQHHAPQWQAKPSSYGKSHILNKKKTGGYIFNLRRKSFNYSTICLKLKIYLFLIQPNLPTMCYVSWFFSKLPTLRPSFEMILKLQLVYQHSNKQSSGATKIQHTFMKMQQIHFIIDLQSWKKP